MLLKIFLKDTHSDDQENTDSSDEKLEHDFSVDVKENDTIDDDLTEPERVKNFLIISYNIN